MNAVARAQLTFQMLTLLKKYLSYEIDANAGIMYHTLIRR